MKKKLKLLATAAAMCQSMFCAIPLPNKAWDDQAEKRMLLFLPLVGLEIGLIWWGLGMLCRILKLPTLISAFALAAYPYLVTGYIHLDGFLDVTDAVKSWRSLERRREILKDSHVGSFAVIACCLLIVCQTVCFASVDAQAPFGILALIPVVSRCCAALAVAALPPMHTSQYAGKKTTAASYWVPGVFLAAALAAGWLFWGKYAICLAATLAGFLLALRRGYRSLQGMNGDISGYSLTLGELAGVAALALL